MSNYDPTTIEVSTTPQPIIEVVRQETPVVEVIIAEGPQGPPGQWIQMTQAQYNALPIKDPNTLYIIIG